MSTRSLQVGATMQRAIQTVLSKGLADPRVKGIITVTRVFLTDDLRQATVFVNITPEQHEDLTMHGLTSASKHIRHEISDALALRQTPNITFKKDDAYKAESHIHAVINKAMQELDAASPEQPTSTPELPEDLP